jgi:hypothetical protein
MRALRVSCSACLICRLLESIERAQVTNGEALLLFCEHHFTSLACADDLLQIDLALSASGDEVDEVAPRTSPML